MSTDKAAPSQEPCAWGILWDDDDGYYALRFDEPKDVPNGKHAIPFYTHPSDAAAQIAELKEKIKELEVRISNQAAQLSGKHQYVGQDFQFRIKQKDEQIAKLEFDLSAEQQENRDKRERIAKLEARINELDGQLCYINCPNCGELAGQNESIINKKLAAAEKDAAQLKSDVVKLADIVMDEYPDGDDRYEIAYVAKSLATADEFMDKIDAAMKPSPGDTVENK